MDKRKRIAIYGGTFDPVHSGHVEISRNVCQLFEIDEFLFMPARMAPHKVDQDSASAFDRHAMLALATQDEPQLSISRFELDGPGRQFTVDTLSHFHERCGEVIDLFFVMGADSWVEIKTWREWSRLPTLANLVVVTRPGNAIAVDSAKEISAQIEDVRGARTAVTVETGRTKIFFTDVVSMDVSSTAVRQAVRDNDFEKLKQLVPTPVADYVRKYGLYRNTNEAQFNC